MHVTLLYSYSLYPVHITEPLFVRVVYVDSRQQIANSGRDTEAEKNNATSTTASLVQQ